MCGLQKVKQNHNEGQRSFALIDQMSYILAGQEHYYFLDGYSGYNHIVIHPDDQEKTTYTSPFRTFAFRRMSFDQYNGHLINVGCFM